MKALAGPAMLLVLVGGFAVYRLGAKEDAPSREFTGLELAADEVGGTCYALDTVLVSNGAFGKAVRTWSAPDEDNEDKWTLLVEGVIQGRNGPERLFQKFTFERADRQVKLVEVEASEGLPSGVIDNIDRLLEAPHAFKATPVDRCLAADATGYGYEPKKK